MMKLTATQQRESLERYGGVPSQKDKRKKRLYNRYFEGYTAFYVPHRQGGEKMKLVRIYTEEYYRQKLSVRSMVLVRVMYFLAFAGAVTSYMAATLSDCYCNTFWYTTVFQFITVVCFTWLFSVLFTYLTNGFNLTVYAYKASSKPLMTSSVYCLATMGMSIISYLICLALHRGQDAAGVMRCTGLVLLSAFLIFLCFFTERKIEYIRVPNEYELPDGAVQL